MNSTYPFKKNSPNLLVIEMATGAENEIPGWITAVGAAVASAIGGFIIAIVNRAPAFQQAMDQKLKILLDGLQAQVKSLTDEVKELKEENAELRKSHLCERRGENWD